MKRFHAHVNVRSLDSSLQFYSQLFGCAPSVTESDYAKWMLDDPRLNFAISTRGGTPGVDHLGLQAEDAAELEQIGDRLRAADTLSLTEKDTTCCYARSDKYWTDDPQGVRWESFLTHGRATTYSNVDSTEATNIAPPVACCGPQSASKSACC